MGPPPAHVVTPGGQWDGLDEWDGLDGIIGPGSNDPLQAHSGGSACYSLLEGPVAYLKYPLTSTTTSVPADALMQTSPLVPTLDSRALGTV